MKIDFDYDGRCLLCKQFVADQYMVKKDVWAEAGFTKGFCHLKCLEHKLGRPLVIDDFTDAPINDAELDTLSIESLERQIEIECPKGMLECLREEVEQTGVSFESLCEEELKCYREAKEVIKTLKIEPIERLWELESFRKEMELDESRY